MDNRTITPKFISVDQLIALMRENPKVKPIDGLNIPNITVPAHLVSKKRQTQASDTLSINIRLLFNSLTADNLAKIKEQLRATIVEKAKSAELIEEVAQEILSNFIISENHIKNYMHLLNAVSSACVLITPPVLDKSKVKSPIDNTTPRNVSPTIAKYFLDKCKDMIFNSIGEANIRKLAEMDQDDSDQLDLYNRERDKIINLIITICCLYDQRNTTNIKLTAIQLFNLINIILNSYAKLQAKMKELGNPYEEDCADEDEYIICQKMCTLYAEQLYTFMSKEAKEFNKDPTLVKGQTLSVLVERFRNEVVPTLNEAYLISKCESIEY
ncbi:hypothetical protein QJ857_gp0513 [Tupanvirus soda lake]|uniref:Uncharacterized protein n=2 Tax=Tupanvirus TaxID=2094720 RepID=A0A6N1NVY8_9VIRU|nr:hypothetical protein QJ857_gp0513 [Tupanvirus soda lake]QKU35528.1 hypothetical protein [Tupanvirus soda lake]